MSANNDTKRAAAMMAADEQADLIAANRRRTRYPEARVLALAEHAAELGIVCHIDGFPFGRATNPKDRP